MKTIKTCVTALISALLVFSPVAYADKWSDQFPHIKATGDIPGDCSYESMSKKNYKGKTLKINTHAVPVMGEPTALHAEQFAKLTGAKVDVTHTPAGDLYAKAMVPFQAGQAPYDIVFGFSNFINDWRRYLEPVPKKYVEMKQMKDVTPSHIGVASWDGVMYQFPVDGDRHYLKYRKDVIDNPEYQKQYKEATGKELRVPQTWKEYGEMAAYFNNWDWDGDGEKEYGSAEVMKKDAPTDASIVTYTVDGKEHQDLTRGSRVKLFDMYYDKFTNVKRIEYGQGTIKPSLWGYSGEAAPKKKKRK